MGQNSSPQPFRDSKDSRIRGFEDSGYEDEGFRISDE
jgi:hypothetical protein